MRRSFVIFGVGALVVASIGFVRRLDNQVATDLDSGSRTPGGQQEPARAPSALGTIAPVSGDPAPGSRLEVQRLLRARDFAGLTHVVEVKQARVEEEVRREAELARVMGAFHTPDPSLRPLIDAWVEAQPAAWAPRLARAEHEIGLAWERRGVKTSSETSKEQFEGMHSFLRAAIEDAQEALRRNVRLAEAYRILVVAAMGFGDQQACLRLAERGTEAVPASLRIRVALAECLLPRWGGSYAMMEALAEESDAHVGKNPALSALHGFVDWDRGRIADQDRKEEEAVALFTRALDRGEHWFFYRARGLAYMDINRHTEALADATRALALAPDEPDALVLRARALIALGRTTDAVPDMQLAIELDSLNYYVVHFRSRELENAAYQGYQLLDVMKDVNGAIARLTAAIALTGGDAEVYYRRGRAHLQAKDEGRALSDFEVAVRLDPHHLETYRNIDYILARRHDWDGVIRYWTQYVELEPMNGRAYLERGGAYNHKGDRTAALADAKKACDLGTREACKIIANARVE